jgi:NAD(P)-dependent dehydrogenase (short-subunit alcohol dehydrogenase family)
MNIVVTGASRGIGLELTRLALGRGDTVMAIARKPDESQGLLRLKKDFGPKLFLVAADLADFLSTDLVTKQLKDWNHVDVLINNAGILRQGTTPEDFMESYKVNSVAPFLMAEAVAPWLKKSSKPKLANVTSLMGSISDNQSGGYYAYRSSKAALNMLNKSLSIDFDWLTSLVIHPGWVKTKMGGAGAPVEPTDSAKGIWQVIDRSELTESGRFFNFTGKQLPW